MLLGATSFDQAVKLDFAWIVERNGNEGGSDRD
jgi:hypothetical protein